MACRMYRLVLVLMLLSVLSCASAKSIKKKVHHLRKRSISLFAMKDTCPPRAFIPFPGEPCQHTCQVDNDCPGNQLCCDNGCNMCMDPVLPPPVIDWLGMDNRGFSESREPNNYIDALNIQEHVQEVSCYYNGVTLSKGQIFYKGCHRCECRMEGINCEVGPCRTDEHEGFHSEGSSGDDEQPSGDNETRVNSRVYARVSGRKIGTRKLARLPARPIGESQEPIDQEVDKPSTEPSEQLTDSEHWNYRERGHPTAQPTAQVIYHTAPYFRHHRVIPRRPGEIRPRSEHTQYVERYPHRRMLHRRAGHRLRH
ncbi:predicted protein [Nematostella vectensis]|uniref:WAP domain-containing protein n=1 Tax=Nematostella vectensis TaxID=45351 RepID=A7S1L0_NEMVE|nr:uncharacterized protein LOC5514198 [Nematostella vectensis]EDO42344.1 predicted protein [Nematostella vectensis]|eukprot:XP_001634407.1 predicted protein [Nematostella vectensis]